MIARLDLGERHFVFAAIRHESSDRRREIEQAADRVTGSSARAQLQHLTEQHQHGDHRGCFKINADLSVVRERRRKRPRK